MKVQLLCFLCFVPFLYVSADEESAEYEEVELKCPNEDFFFTGIGSRSPFFGNSMGISCSNKRREKICEEEETSDTFHSEDQGKSLSAGCANGNDIIKSFKLKISDAHVISMSLVCCPLKDTVETGDSFGVSSANYGDTLADCGDDAAVQKISLSDAGDGMVTRVDLRCLKLIAETGEVPIE